MSRKEHEIHAIANIVWKKPKEIGRELPPPGSKRFAATARLSEDNISDLFSVVLYYSIEDLSKVKLHFLAPELVLPKLKIGSTLYITDGPKVVATVKIIKVNL